MDRINEVCNKGWKFYFVLFDFGILFFNFNMLFYLYKKIVFLLVFYGCEFWCNLFLIDKNKLNVF